MRLFKHVELEKRLIYHVDSMKKKNSKFILYVEILMHTSSLFMRSFIMSLCCCKHEGMNLLVGI